MKWYPVHRSNSIALLLALLVSWPLLAGADQRAPELATLFAALSNADDAAAAHVVEQQIWELWFKPPNEHAGALFTQGRSAVEKGELPAAKAAFDQLISEFPEFAEGWNQRAIVHFLLNDLEAALADVDKTLALEPHHFGALSGRGQCYIRMERPREALAAFEETLKVDRWLDGIAQQTEMLRAFVNRQHRPQAI